MLAPAQVEPSSVHVDSMPQMAAAQPSNSPLDRLAFLWAGFSGHAKRTATWAKPFCQAAHEENPIQSLGRTTGTTLRSQAPLCLYVYEKPRGKRLLWWNPMPRENCRFRKMLVPAPHDRWRRLRHPQRWWRQERKRGGKTRGPVW